MVAASGGRGVLKFRALLGDICLYFKGIRALLRPGLRSFAGRKHRRHMRRNRAALKIRYSFARRILSFASRWPVVCAMLALTAYAVVAGGAAAVAPPTWTPVKPDVDDFFRDIQTINLGLMGAQATLLGLVYPLVIALISLVFQSQTSSTARLQVYFKETEALSVGGVSLSFIAAVGAQLLFYGILENNIAVSITVLNVIWFTGNLIALGFFVLRSLEFVRPARRQILMKSFMANTAWSAQFYEALMSHSWANASAYGLLPKPPEDEIFISPYDFDLAIEKKNFKDQRVLRDIRVGVLALLLSKEVAGRVIRFTPWPGFRYDGEAVLVRGEGVNSRRSSASWSSVPLASVDPIAGRPRRRRRSF